jgi:tripartite-type tricarboxylate transporter receptor subunit TctC
MNSLANRVLRRLLHHAPGFIAGFIMVFICPLLNAQEYPTKPVRIIVPVGPGGATDILSRTLGQQLTNIWGQPVIVDNRPGGGSNIGFDVAAKAPPDGYTLLMAQPAFTVNVSLYKKLPYDPIRDFSAVCLAARGSSVLVVHPSVPVYSVKDLIALAKAKPGKLTYASSGMGTTLHLSGELFKTMTGVDILHVPYKGAGPARTPPAVITRLNRDITRTLTHPEMIKALNNFGLDPAEPTSPEEFTAYLRAEISKWAKVVKASGASAE